MSRRPAGPRGGHCDAGAIVGGIAALVLVAANGVWLPVALTRPGYAGPRPVAGGMPLRQWWEDTAVDIWCPLQPVRARQRQRPRPLPVEPAPPQVLVQLPDPDAF